MHRNLLKVLGILCVVSITAISGCTNTFKGAQRDINNLGNELNPPKKTVTTTTTTTKLSSKLDATNKPIQKNSDAIPEESY